MNGGASGKKKAIQDIFKVEDEPNDKEEIRDDRDGSRSRSRSRSRHGRGLGHGRG